MLDHIDLYNENYFLYIYIPYKYDLTACISYTFSKWIVPHKCLSNTSKIIGALRIIVWGNSNLLSLFTRELFFNYSNFWKYLDHLMQEKAFDNQFRVASLNIFTKTIICHQNFILTRINILWIYFANISIYCFKIKYTVIYAPTYLIHRQLYLYVYIDRIQFVFPFSMYIKYTYISKFNALKKILKDQQ